MELEPGTGHHAEDLVAHAHDVAGAVTGQRDGGAAGMPPPFGTDLQRAMHHDVARVEIEVDIRLEDQCTIDREAAKRGRLNGEWKLFIEGLRVPEGLEKAVETALSFHADALLCADPERALHAAAWLREGKAASVVMLPGAPPAPGAVPEGSLAAAVGAESVAAEWARTLLGSTVLAESLAALGWRTVVTGLGDLFTATGLPGLRRQDLDGAPVAGRYVRAILT